MTRPALVDEQTLAAKIRPAFARKTQQMTRPALVDEQTLIAKIRPAFARKDNNKFFDKFLSKWRSNK